MANGNGPLTDDDLVKINQAIDQSKELEQQIDLAARAGLDMAGPRAQLKDARDKALRIKQTYFPGR